MTILILLLSVLLFPSSVFAAWHLYLVPYNLQDVPALGLRNRPDFDGETVIVWRAFRYGGEPWTLIAANVSDALDTAIAAKPNIQKIPDNLDQQVGSGGALTFVRNLFETRHIPGTWIQATTTYRQIIRISAGMFGLLQHYRKVSGNYGPVFVGGVTLDTTFGSLPLKARTDLLQTAADLNISTAGFTGASTLRQILKGVGDQFANRQMRLGGITI